MALFDLCQSSSAGKIQLLYVLELWDKGSCLDLCLFSWFLVHFQAFSSPKNHSTLAHTTLHTGLQSGLHLKGSANFHLVRNVSGDYAGGKKYNIPVLCNELFQGNEVSLWPYSLQTCVVILDHLSTLSFNPYHSKTALDWQKAQGGNHFVLCLCFETFIIIWSSAVC